MPLRLLCLHGWGTNINILQSQLSALISDLHQDNTATFYLIEGEVDSVPGPGIEGFHEGPYYSYYHFPQPLSTPSEAATESLLHAYDRLYRVLAEDGPFDGLLGFSHGGTLAAGFLIHHAKLHPHSDPPVRCAVFINALPPFRMDVDVDAADPASDPVPVVDEDLHGYINIPTVSVGGAKDPLCRYSVALHRLCHSALATWVLHGRGHDVPRDRRDVALIAAAIRKLAVQVQVRMSMG
ncbi:hypothetical protein ARAM_003824, partial [Aspergillus rambellii]